MSEKNDSYKVSIILPTYNRAGLIMETIESIRNQTYANWELIVVDDGSDDNTEELIHQVKDERIRFYKAGRIGIVGKIKNIGIQKMTGEFIAFIDSDDLWDESKLEKQIDTLQQYPEAGFSLTGGYNFKTLNEPLAYFYKQREGIWYDNILVPFFRSEVSATTPSLILRKKCLNLTGLFKESKPFADVEFILSLAKNFKAVVLYEPLFFRRIHDANDSDSNWIKRHYEGIEMILSYKDSLPGNVVADTLFRSNINFGEKCLRHNMRKQAINSFVSALKQKPFNIMAYKKVAKAIIFYLQRK